MNMQATPRHRVDRTEGAHRMRVKRGLSSILVASSLMLGTATASSDLPAGALCRRDFRAVDDQADVDVRDLNRRIELLESEITDPGLSGSEQSFKDGLRDKLEAAKVHRSEVLDKQHDDLNSIRARCDRMRDGKQRENAAKASRGAGLFPENFDVSA